MITVDLRLSFSLLTPFPPTQARKPLSFYLQQNVRTLATCCRFLYRPEGCQDSQIRYSRSANQANLIGHLYLPSLTNLVRTSTCCKPRPKVSRQKSARLSMRGSLPEALREKEGRTMTWWSSSCLSPLTTTTPTKGSTPLTRRGKPPPCVAYWKDREGNSPKEFGRKRGLGRTASGTAREGWANKVVNFAVCLVGRQGRREEDAR